MRLLSAGGEHVIKFNEEWEVVKACTGLDAEPEGEQGEVVRALNGEAARNTK